MRYPASRILLIATRQIGDVLLATPLLRSLRNAYPGAGIDVLAYRRTGGMLEGNPDLDTLIEVDEHPSRDSYLALLRRILRRYDLAISTLQGDRPSIYAFLAASRRVSIVPSLHWKAAWKRWLAHGWILLDNANTHTVTQNLRLTDVLTIPRHYEVVPPSRPDAVERLERLLPFPWRQQPYVVIHPFPMWRYKRWPHQAWRELASHLNRRGYWLVLSGGPVEEERAYVRALADSLAPEPVVDLAGQLSFGELAELLRSCACYVGPDTSVTHLAAACGAPTVAIYGPTNPVKWGPWPAGYTLEQSPYTNRGNWQRQGNVLLLQGLAPCVPCHQEGCERHKKSYSHCLDQLPAAQVIAGVESLLAGPT
jgi:heptosyltransferase III